MFEEDDLLATLLTAATEELVNLNKNGNSLKETNLFEQKDVPAKETLPNNNLSSVVHNGDTDSSDDEGNRNYEDKKYNEYGREIKHLLENTSSTYCHPDNEKQVNKVSSWKSKALLAPPHVSASTTVEKPKVINKSIDVYTDPIFGLRIINPLISSVVLKERMAGREAVPFASINRHLQIYGKEKDWVIAGVVASKCPVKTSQKGSQYSIWSLTDLKGDIKTVSFFLFSSAHKQLWKTAVGTVIGVLNPNVLDKKDGSKDEACLSIDNPQRVMIFGQSKDFGTCKSVKKNGDPCTAIVNLNRCEFCIYHIKQEYQKCSKRSDLQANFAGKGLVALRNKVLGKNEVFYAGKSYMAIPSKRSKKLEQKDNKRLDALTKMGVSTTSINIKKAKNNTTSLKKQNASRLEVTQAQRLRDMQLLKKLGGAIGIDSKNTFTGKHSSNVTLEESKTNAVLVIDKLKARNNASTTPNKKSQCDLECNLLNGNNSNMTSTKDKSGSKAGSYDELKEMTNYLHKTSTEISTLPNIQNAKNAKENLNCTFETTAVIENKQNNPEKSKVNVLNESWGNGNTYKKELCTTNPKTSVESYLLHMNFPMLSGFGSNNIIDLNKPIIPKHVDRAKLNAIKFIQRNGPLKKVNPNSTKGSGKKRPIEAVGEEDNTQKKSKLADSDFISDRFKKMMAATSKHLDLLEVRDEEEKEKYFNKLEIKERMEEKMVNTFKIACKAVRCLKCKYTNFSASEMCKKEKHPLKVFDAMKRFFKCGNCGNRTVSLEIIPTTLCKNCGSGKWEKTGMMKEKVAVVAHSLSIRGGEQKFVNSVATDANINLLVLDS